MAWLSFVIVALLLYNPLFSVNALLPGVATPPLGYGILGLYGLAGWVLLWLGLLGIDALLRGNLLGMLRLNNGYLFVEYPEISSHLAFALAVVIPIAGVVASIGLQLFHSFPQSDLAMKAVALSVLTLAAFLGFRLEQRLRYSDNLRRQRAMRKKQQKAIVIPPMPE
ncbi:MAG: hypothetical protein U0822_09955 [Anaerolineae bacterium]